MSKSEVFKKGEVKKSWLKFGFPQSYTSDVLETLYWMAKSNIPLHEEFNDALTSVITTMDPAGYWLNQIAFRSPMLVEIEAKKSPSKWLTFRACLILQTYADLLF